MPKATTKLSHTNFTALLFITLGMIFSQTALSATAKACYKNGWSKEKLLSLKEQHFEISDELMNPLAIQLMDCLGDTDPKIRDGVAYEAYFTWLRGNKLSLDTQLTLFTSLTSILTNSDQENITVLNKQTSEVYLPFVVLALAEVVRVDRKTPYLSESQRAEIVNAVSQYLTQLTDYRGFDESIGWRHGVAHSADLILQLILNPQITKAQRDTMLVAIASQISAKNNHFYIYGESKRLALPVLYLWLQEQHTLIEWQRWLDEVINPAPLNNWQESYVSQQGLAKRHNVSAFLTQLLALIESSDNDKLSQLTPSIMQALQTLN